MINKFFLIILIIFLVSSKAEDLDGFISSLQENEEKLIEKKNTVVENITLEENLIKNQDSERFTDNVKVRILDKITGKSSIIKKKIGSVHEIKNLEFLFLKCWKSSPEEVPENKLLLKIIEIDEKTNTKKTIFFGWVFSSSPSLNTFNNDSYDIALINCEKD